MMKKIIHLLILSFFVTLSQNGVAQADRLKEADKKFDRYAFIDAQNIYLEVAEAGYKSANLFKKLGDSFYFNSDFVNAEKWYGELFELEQDLPKEYYYRYAQSLRAVEKYDLGDKYLIKYDEMTEADDSRVQRLRSEKNYLELIELQSGKFKVDPPLAFNSDLSDFAPTFYGDSYLVFASNREKPNAVQRVHEWNNQPYLDLYEIKLGDSLKVDGEPKEMPKIINSPFHEASAVFTKDRKTMYFTRNNLKGKKLGKSEDGTNYLKIYRSDRTDKGEWGEPVDLPFNSDEFSVAHPALSPDEKKLYFSSDMPETLGMSDIFVVDINEDGTYSEPRNLGPEINTEGNESFPFISDDGLLFFSSNGHVGLGGLDIFVSVIKRDGSFGEAFNLGRPINSSKDDFSFIINSDLQVGFFASNRNIEKGQDDIYRFVQNEELITECNQYLEGIISDIETGSGIPEVLVELFDEQLKSIDKMLTNSKGAYSFKVECDQRYIVRVSKDGFITFEELVRTGNQYESGIQQDLSLQSGDDLGVTRAGQGDDLRNILQLDPIYFDFDKADIRKDAEVELQKVVAVLKSYPQMRIDIRSHTDSRAGDAYNMILSERRAQATVNYIVNQGVNKTRVTGKGYGETQLLNHCSNNVDCSEEEHAINRRSEFIIINENETPEGVRKMIAQRIDAKEARRSDAKGTTTSRNVQQKASKNKLPASVTSYDFDNSTDEVFTVQIGAFGVTSEVEFDLPEVFSNAYSDGFKRYFSGKFKTREDANAHKEYVRQNGVPGAFVVGIRGNERF